MSLRHRRRRPMRPGTAAEVTLIVGMSGLVVALGWLAWAVFAARSAGL